MSLPTLLVGAGYVGRRFTEIHDGEVIGLNRPAFDLDADVDRPDLPEPYNVLYTVPPSSEALDDLRLSRLLAVLDPAPRHFVYISTTGVYGNRDGAQVDEATPVHPETDRAKRRVAAEEQVADFGVAHDCTTLVLRVPGIYGPGRLGIERIRAGTPVLREADTGPGNRIHVDDLVACCIAALADHTPGGIYNVGDADRRSSTWFAGEVARQAGLDAPRQISFAQAEREFSEMRMSFLRESRLVSFQKMRDVLGVRPRYENAEDGIAASLQG